jgi:tetratricopeptide (TPR) repeat protein
MALGYLAQSDVAPMATRANLRSRGLSAAQRALSLDPHQGEALAAQVQSLPMYRNWLNYERACRAALRRQPRNAFLNSMLSGLLAQVGRHREALEHIELASQSAPDGPWTYWSRGLILWSLGRFDEADTVLERGMALWPRHYAVWFGYLYYVLYNGRATQAAALIEDVSSRPTGIPDWNYDWLDQQARAIASGNADSIKAAVRLSGDIARRGTGFAGDTAVFASFVGDMDTAFRMLDALYFDRGFVMPDAYFATEQGLYTVRNRDTYHLFEPPTAALRKDPRFAQLTRKLGLDVYWRATNSRALVIA